jgi:Raf kinase inhibitor-like YbhB/YbcL family protein
MKLFRATTLASIGLTIALATAIPAAQAASFTVTSNTIRPNQNLSIDQVYNGFGCYGRNISPEISWQNPPAGTKSYAVTAYDPDAPTGSGWWHWVVYNIPGNVSGVAENAGTAENSTLPSGSVQGRTDFGTSGFGGACPPPGDKPHRYVFTVHALKVDKLDLPADATAALVGYMINANRLGKASFTARFGRPAQ